MIKLREIHSEGELRYKLGKQLPIEIELSKNNIWLGHADIFSR